MARGKMKVYKTRRFARFAKDEALTDAQLIAAINEAERGLVDADLGGGVIKQRIPRPGQGKSGGFRAVLAYRSRTRAVFLIGFAKSRQANVRPDELENLKLLAADLLNATPAVMARMTEEGRLLEVCYDPEKD
jgi:hypothetical protein